MTSDLSHERLNSYVRLLFFKSSQFLGLTFHVVKMYFFNSCLLINLTDNLFLRFISYF